MARNGYLAEDGIALVTVEDDDQLIATAAASYLAMKAAAARDRVALAIVEPAGAYRRAWIQNDMVDHPERYNLNPASTILFGRYGQSHGWGNRIDVNSAALPWMLRNAARFGWTREYGTRDPNHFKHDGVTAAGGGSTSGSNTQPNAIIDVHQEDTDMRIIHSIRAGVGEYIVFASPTRVELSPELSTLPASERQFHINVAAAQNGKTLDVWDETANGSWYQRDQLARTMAGMPADFPLSPTNPWERPTGGSGAVFDQAALVAALAATVPTEAEIAEAVADEQAERLKS